MAVKTSTGVMEHFAAVTGIYFCTYIESKMTSRFNYISLIIIKCALLFFVLMTFRGLEHLGFFLCCLHIQVILKYFHVFLSY